MLFPDFDESVGPATLYGIDDYQNLNDSTETNTPHPKENDFLYCISNSSLADSSDFGEILHDKDSTNAEDSLTQCPDSTDVTVVPTESEDSSTELLDSTNANMVLPETEDSLTRYSDSTDVNIVATESEDFSIETKDSSTKPKDSSAEPEGPSTETEDSFIKLEDPSTETEDSFIKLEDLSTETEDCFIELEDLSTETEDCFIELEDLSTETEDCFIELEDLSTEPKDSANANIVLPEIEDSLTQPLHSSDAETSTPCQDSAPVSDPPKAPGFPGDHDVYCFRKASNNSEDVYMQTLHIHNEGGRCIHAHANTDDCKFGRWCNGMYFLVGGKTYCFTSDIIHKEVKPATERHKRVSHAGCTKIGVLKKDSPQDRVFSIEIVHDIARHFEKHMLFRERRLDTDRMQKIYEYARKSEELQLSFWTTSWITCNVHWEQDTYKELGTAIISEVKQQFAVSQRSNGQQLTVRGLASEARSSQIREGCLITKKVTPDELESLHRSGHGPEDMFLGIVIELGVESEKDEGVIEREINVQPLKYVVKPWRDFREIKSPTEAAS